MIHGGINGFGRIGRIGHIGRSVFLSVGASAADGERSGS